MKIESKYSKYEKDPMVGINKMHQGYTVGVSGTKTSGADRLEVWKLKSGYIEIT